MFLEINDFLKCPYRHAWVLDMQAAPGVLSTWPGPNVKNAGGCCPLPNRQERRSAGITDVSVTLGKPLAQPPRKDHFSLWLAFACTKLDLQSAALVNVPLALPRRSCWVAEYLACSTKAVLLLLIFLAHLGLEMVHGPGCESHGRGQWLLHVH